MGVGGDYHGSRRPAAGSGCPGRVGNGGDGGAKEEREELRFGGHNRGRRPAATTSVEGRVGSEGGYQVRLGV